MTTEEFARHPDRKNYVLIDGQVIERQDTFLTSFIAGNAMSCLREYGNTDRTGYVLGSGLGYVFARRLNTVRKPSVSYIQAKRMTDAAMKEDFCSIVPDLIVEVLSPKDLADEVDQKVEEWLAAGVRLVWVINPRTKQVRVYGSDGGYGLLREADTLTAEAVLPGFRCPVADLFRLPAAPG